MSTPPPLPRGWHLAEARDPETGLPCGVRLFWSPSLRDRLARRVCYLLALAWDVWDGWRAPR